MASQQRGRVLMSESEVFVKKQAASYLGVSVRTLSRMVGEGEGPPRIRVRSRWMYSRADLAEFVANRERQQSGTDAANVGHEDKAA